jgi:hypothetical protein
MPNRYGLTPPSAVTDPPHYQHDPARTLESPDGRMRLVPIEKCMSTVVQQWCSHEGWREQDRWQAPSAVPHVVVLRDPVERWCSAVWMYLLEREWDWRREPDSLAWHIIEDVMVMDTHTEPQYRRLVGLPLQQIQAVDMADRPHLRLNELLCTDFFGATTRHTRDLPGWLARRLDDGLRDRIQQRYNQDYWLRMWLLDAPMPEALLAQRDATQDCKNLHTEKNNGL